MTTLAEFAAQWRAFADLDDAAQVTAMVSKLSELSEHPEPVLAQEVGNLLEVEVDSDDATMERLTRNRLRAWLTLPPEMVERLSAATEAARKTLAGPSAMRSTMGVQSAIRALDRDEITRLVEIAPSTRNAIAPEMLDAITTVAARLSDRPTASGNGAPASETIRMRRPWWKFW